MKRVAVEPTLENVVQALAGRGYEVVRMEEGTLPRADAYVVSGSDQNLLGIQATEGNRAPVISAAGRSAEEVVREVEQRA